jgi:hypothetical protein
VHLRDSEEWRANRAVAVAIPYEADFEGFFFMRERLVAARDTLIVLGLQIVFRVTMFFRHLKY